MYYKHILVPTDGSPLSGRAVTEAIAFAKDSGARITFFHAQKAFQEIYFGPGVIFDSNAPAQFREIQGGLANDILDAAEKQAREAGIECSRLTMVCEKPYEAIIEAAKRQNCDLIFMASNARTGIDALILGSETRQVLSRSRIPVLVYR